MSVSRHPLRLLTKLSPPAILTLSVLGVFLAGLGDYLTGDDAAFTLLYLLPVALASWAVGFRGGAAVSLLSACSWLMAAVWGQAPLRPLVFSWNLLTELGVFLFSARILSGLRDHLRLESGRARTDTLTGLANRRAFVEAVILEAGRSRRSQQPFTLGLIDLDGFKAINDRWGHQAGDRVLVTLADALRTRLRAVDLAARWGGDEFALLLPETPAERAEPLLRELRRRCVDALQNGGWPLTVSLGGLTCDTPPDDLEQTMHEVDALLYEAKRLGKDRLVHLRSMAVHVNVSRPFGTPPG